MEEFDVVEGVNASAPQDEPSDMGTVEDTDDGQAPDESEPQGDVDQGQSPDKDYKAEAESYKEALRRERESKKLAQLEIKRLRESRANATIPLDEDGDVDPAQLEERIVKRVRREYEYKDELSRDWNKATQKYPIMLENDAIAKAVDGYRQAKLLEGEIISFQDAADEIVGVMSQAQAKGREDAHVSVRTATRAGVTAPAAPSGKSASVVERFKAGQLTPEEIRKNWNKLQGDLS